MNIGHRIYFEITTGNVVYPIRETREGSDPKETTQIEDFALYPHLKALNPVNYDFIQLDYTDIRNADLETMGSCHVDPTTKALTIYPRLTIASDKVQITANGTDTATITVTVQGTVSPHAISFTVNNGAPVVVNTANGIATLPITTTLIGDYVITAVSDLYGTNSVTVKGV